MAQYFKDPGTFRLKAAPSLVAGHAGLLPGQPADSITDCQAQHIHVTQPRQEEVDGVVLPELAHPDVVPSPQGNRFSAPVQVASQSRA